MKRAHLLEIAIAGGIGFSAVLAFFGFQMMMPPRRRFGSYLTYEERLRRMEAQTAVGKWMIAAAALIFVVCLVVGLVVALGIGPDWMAVRRRNRTLVGKLVHFPDGSTLEDGDCMDADGVRYYVRIRDPEGGTTEFSCTPEQYVMAATGWTGTIRHVGRRLVALESGRR